MSSAFNRVVQKLDWPASVFTPARLSQYQAAMNGDPAGVLKLYSLNLQASAEMHLWLGLLEITLRNALIETLMPVERHEGFDPLLSIWADLSPAEKGAYKKAQNQAATKAKPGNFNALITELPFGFWRSLLSSKHQTSLWVTNFRWAFPGLRQKRRATVFSAVESAVELRNRIAHHEPIFNRHLGQDLAQIQQIIGWISPEALAWARANLPCEVIGVRWGEGENPTFT